MSFKDAYPALTEMGVTPFMEPPVAALEIVAARVLELERLLGVQCLDEDCPSCRTRRLDKAHDPFTTPQMDEIQPSPRDLCRCGHARRAHTMTGNFRGGCAYGQIGTPLCGCLAFKLAP